MSICLKRAVQILLSSAYLKMGIRGLTKFFQEGSIMQEYELQKTKLVIDGNSLCCSLYAQWHDASKVTRNYFECFGGDYDRFGKVVDDFFKLLEQCRVIPFVVFDGGYETKKIDKIIKKRNDKLKFANKLNPKSELREKNQKLFCLLMIKTVEDIIRKRKISTVRCDLEGDLETANIARKLGNCPVLSFDSDFFIYGCLYIPFYTLDIKFDSAHLVINEFATFVNCKIFKIKKFLESYPGLEKKSLLMLPVLLGNDYIEISRFVKKTFMKCKYDIKDVITQILSWLQGKPIKKVLEIVISDFQGKKQKNDVLHKIKNAIESYNYLADSKFLKYLCERSFNEETNKFSQFNYIQSLNVTKTQTEIVSTSTAPLDEVELLDFNQKKIPLKFLEKFRKVIYPACFMNILLQNKYYYVVQIEFSAQEHSHKVSFDILSAIHKILTGSDIGLYYVGPKNYSEEIPLCSISLPTYEQIETYTNIEKKKFILRILGIDDAFLNCLNLFPDSWHIYLLSINYFLKKTSSSWHLILSLINCKLILGYVDKKAGFFRSKKEFDEQHKSFLDRQEEISVSSDIEISLQNICEYDAIKCLKAIVQYFETDPVLITNKRGFDRNLVYCLSQFQSCLEHIDYLNILFESPFPTFFIQECLNCTFVYNLTNAVNRGNVESHVAFLKEAPDVLNSFNNIVKTLKQYIKFNISNKRSAEQYSYPYNKKRLRSSM